MDEDPDLTLSLSHEEETDLFAFTLTKDQNRVFQIRLTFDQFERLATDMYRMIKEKNLAQIRDYERRKAESEIFKLDSQEFSAN